MSLANRSASPSLPTDGHTGSPRSATQPSGPERGWRHFRAHVSTSAHNSHDAVARVGSALCGDSSWARPNNERAATVTTTVLRHIQVVAKGAVFHWPVLGLPVAAKFVQKHPIDLLSLCSASDLISAGNPNTIKCTAVQQQNQHVSTNCCHSTVVSRGHGRVISSVTLEYPPRAFKMRHPAAVKRETRARIHLPKGTSAPWNAPLAGRSPMFKLNRGVAVNWYLDHASSPAASGVADASTSARQHISTPARQHDSTSARQHKRT